MWGYAYEKEGGGGGKKTGEKFHVDSKRIEVVEELPRICD